VQIVYPSIRAVVISMPSATARRAALAAAYRDCPFPWAVMDASDGATTVVPYREDLALRTMGRRLKAAEIGCFDSHLRALQGVLSGTEDFVLICEDDVQVDFSFPFSTLAAAMRESGVDYVRLYSRRVPAARHLTYWRGRWLVRYLWEPFGTQAYLVSRRGAERLLGSADSIHRPVDDHFDRSWENGLPSYSVFPHPVLETGAVSSIIRSSDESWTPARRLAYKARRARDRILSVGMSPRWRGQDRRFVEALDAVDGADDAT
jgi:glycosyl transferase family 25